MMLKTISEVKEFRQQQVMQEEAALLGLQGLASGFSRHAFLEARAERGAGHILQLLAAGKEEEAYELMQSNTWGEEVLEEEEQCHTTTSS